MEQTREQAAKELKALGEERAKLVGQANFNEAETRLLLVDRILRILGWSDEDFRPEKQAGTRGYTDYLLTVDEIPRLIVEAKKVGHTFLRRHQGQGHLRKTEYLLSYLQQTFDQGFTDVIQQAKGYAFETGVPFALLTNGQEWVLAQLIPPPGRDLADLKCFYFGNLLVEQNSFDLMWSMVSKPAVLSGQLEESLSSVNSIEAEYCCEPRTLLGELRWQSSSDADDSYIETFYHRFFDEIVDVSRRHMLEHCYVTNPRLDQFESELKRTLQDTIPAYIQDAQNLTPADTQKILPGNLGEQKGRVVLVVGSVGAGKTTFVTKTMILNRKSSMRFIHIDLIDEAAPAQNWDSFTARLWAKILDKWNDEEADALTNKTLRQTFHRELETLRKGPMAPIFKRSPERLEEEEAKLLQRYVENPEIFIKRSWYFYRKTKRQAIVVFFDNVDRASESLQKGMYSLSHQLSAETGATVIVTMRESTYFRAQEGGFFDVRSDQVFHLQSPDVVQLLSRRIDYVLNHCNKDHRLAAWKKEPHWDSFSAASTKFANTLKTTFLQSPERTKSVGVLAAVAWHNVRYFLRTLSRVHRVIGAKYSEWSLAEIISALLSLSLSDEGGQISTGLYRPIAKRYKCFFLKVRMLIFLAHGLKAQEQRRGVPFGRLLSFLKCYGYREKWIHGALEELVQERMIECLEIPTEVEFTARYVAQEKHSFRLSPLGTVMLDSIQFERVFLAMIGWELPFHNPNRMKIFDREARILGAGEIELRLDREGVVKLLKSPIPEVVVSLLEDCLQSEGLVSSKLTVKHEIATTEDWVKRFLKRMKQSMDKDLLSVQQEAQAPAEEKEKPHQQALFSSGDLAPPGAFVDPHFVVPPIPSKIHELRCGTSTTGPLIFWALVAAHVNGQKFVSGAEITRIINARLVDDEHRLEPTNVSKSLRGRVMREQKWLADREIKGRTVFLLADGWQDEWRSLFGSSPPES